jgi:hypothetical protein
MEQACKSLWSKCKPWGHNSYGTSLQITLEQMQTL